MRIKEDFDLTLYNSYRVKAKCKRAFFPTSETDFVEIYQNRPEVKKIVLGGGFNVILSKEYYDYDFILLGTNFSEVEIRGNIIEAEAGIDLRTMSEMALAHSLSGMEIYYDIPSSMGGAVVMNAGASGEEIKDILTKVRYLDLSDMQVKEILRKDMNFEYRNSFFQKHSDKIVLKTWLKLSEDSPENIREKMVRIKTARWAKQPKEFPNAGSVFKRPKGYYVGAIMEELELKGFAIGGARISEKHGGFIVNYNNATGQDILELIELIQSRVFKKYGFEIEIEQRII